MRRWLFALLLLFAAEAQATVRYVAKDDCGGVPAPCYTTIQAAFDVANAGDSIRIRNAATAYTESPTASRSGATGNPIVIEPDIGNTPNLLGQITISDADYWTIRNLTWDATSTSSTPANAIRATAQSRDVVGITISGNTILGWGGTNQSNGGNGVAYSIAVLIDGKWDGPTYFLTANVTDNTITNPIETGIEAVHTLDSTISNNTISGVRCGATWVFEVGILVELYGSGNTIDGNDVYGFQTQAACYAELYNVAQAADAQIVGIYCDAGHEGGGASKNKVHDLTDEAVGIFWEASCNNGVMANNVIWNLSDSGGTAMQLRGSGCAGNTGNKFLNNTLYDVVNGIVFWDYGDAVDIQNNIVVLSSGGAEAIHTEPDTLTCALGTINNNIYYKLGGGNPLWNWGGSQTSNFSTWKTNCSCDSASFFTDPKLVGTPP